MGATIDALAETGRIVTESPFVLLVAVVTAIVAPIVGTALGFIPLLGGLIYTILVQPIFIGGLLHISNRALDGGVNFEEYIDGIRENYASMAGMYAIFVGILIVVTIIGAIFILIFGASSVLGAVGEVGGGGFNGGFGPGDPGSPGAGLGQAVGGILLTVFFTLLAMLIIGIFLQFIEPAVVIGGEGAAGAFSASFSTVTSHPLSVLGYTVIRLVFFLLANLLQFGVLFGAAAPGLEFGSATEIGTTIALFLLGIVGYVGISVYHAVYYRRVNDLGPREDSESDSERQDPAAGSPSPVQ